MLNKIAPTYLQNLKQYQVGLVPKDWNFPQKSESWDCPKFAKILGNLFKTIFGNLPDTRLPKIT